ncbi:hypothetical protein D3C73_1056890 [compost metagenome]
MRRITGLKRATKTLSGIRVRNKLCRVDHCIGVLQRLTCSQDPFCNLGQAGRDEILEIHGDVLALRNR